MVALHHYAAYDSETQKEHGRHSAHKEDTSKLRFVSLGAPRGEVVLSNLGVENFTACAAMMKKELHIVQAVPHFTISPIFVVPAVGYHFQEASDSRLELP